LGEIINDAGGINVYNFRQFGDYEFGYIADWLNNNSVMYNAAPNITF